MMEVSNQEIDFSGISEIRVSIKALTKMFSYTRAVDSEIGGILLVDTEGEIPFIKDAILYKQTVGVGSVEINAEDLAKQVQRLSIKNPSKIELMKGWWHSHNDFGTFWSGTDDECFETFLSVSPVVYGIVVNKQGSLKARVDIKTEVGTIKINDIKVVVDIESSKMKYKKEAWRKVTKEEPKIVGFGTQSYGYPGKTKQWWEEKDDEKEKEFEEKFVGGGHYGIQ